MAKVKQAPKWRNRIIESGELPADQFLAHPENARRHPARQREALRGSLDELGWIARVLVSARSGRVLDGHARIEEAITKNEAQLIPYDKLDVTEEEERKILGYFDPITGLAEYDVELRDISTQPLPTMGWALIGLPLNRWGEIADSIEHLARADGVICRTTINNNDHQD